MQSKILSGWKILMVILVGLIIFLTFLFFLIPENSVQNSLVLFVKKMDIPLIGSSVSPIGRPVRLRIPSISVDVAVESAGLTFDGSMDTPKNPDNAAWFELGPRPGENGSAVMAGHFDKENGAPAVFSNLSKLRQGDKLYVEDEKGITVVFVARESRNYDPNADASDVFDSNDGKAHLNLITCEGVWNRAAKSYSKRLVVFTDKVDSISLPQE